MKNKWYVIFFILLAIIVFGKIGYNHYREIQEQKQEELQKQLKYSQVFEKVNYFVEQLNTIYDHYDAYGKYAETVYMDTIRVTITPHMRIICVTLGQYDCNAYQWADELSILIERAHYACESKKLVEALKEHYKDDTRINDIFINGNNYITIDCRYK